MIILIKRGEGVKACFRLAVILKSNDPNAVWVTISGTGIPFLLTSKVVRTSFLTGNREPDKK